MASCTIEDVTDTLGTADIDKVLGDILLHHEGDTKKFLITMLDFLKRKTNFFKLSDAKKRVLDAYKDVSGEGDGIRSGFFGSKDNSKPAASKVAKSTPSATQVRQQLGLCLLHARALLSLYCNTYHTTQVPSSAATAATPSSAPSASQAAATAAAATVSQPEEVPDSEEHKDKEAKGLSEQPRRPVLLSR
jgi:hypothetical protein